MMSLNSLTFAPTVAITVKAPPLMLRRMVYPVIVEPWSSGVGHESWRLVGVVQSTEACTNGAEGTPNTSDAANMPRPLTCPAMVPTAAKLLRPPLGHSPTQP